MDRAFLAEGARKASLRRAPLLTRLVQSLATLRSASLFCCGGRSGQARR
jgi:hypothetical protein